MKKDEAMKALYSIQHRLGFKEFSGDPDLSSIFLQIEMLKAKASKFDDLADLVNDYRNSYYWNYPKEEEYRQGLLEKIRKFKTTY